MLDEQNKIEALKIVHEWGNTGTSYFINEQEYELIKVLSKALIAVIRNSTFDNEDSLQSFVAGILCTAASVGRAHGEQPHEVERLINALELDLE